MTLTASPSMSDGAPAPGSSVGQVLSRGMFGANAVHGELNESAYRVLARLQ